MKLVALSKLACVLLLTTTVRAEQLSFAASTQAPHGSDESVLRVPAFDTRLGTLVRIEITVETVIDAHVSVENIGPQLTFAHVDLDSSVNVRVPGQGAPFVLSDSRWAMCALPPSDGTPDFAGPSSMQFSARFTLSAKLVLTSNLDKFETSGSPRRIALRATANSASTVTCDQPTISNDNFNSTYRVRVTYVFDRP